MRAVNPATGECVGAEFALSSRHDLLALADAAYDAVDFLADASGAQLAGFLEDFAARLDRDRDAIAALAHEETALPLSPRLNDVEFSRMTGQLRMAANCLADESWREVARDDGRSLSSVLMPLGGAVVVMGPSNFPLAFNAVGGGDFCAAFAARNPVIMKAHPAHPNTTARVFTHACAARDAAGLPKAALQLFTHCEASDGEALLEHAAVAALAFTGSRQAGLRLKAVCDRLGKPVSVELAAVNPVFVASHAASARAEAIAEIYCLSVLLGAGQFCTKPGVLFVADEAAAARVTARAREMMRAAPVAVLLTQSVRAGLAEIIGQWRAVGAVLECGANTREPGYRYEPTLLSVSASTARANRELLNREAFGPLAIIVAVEGDAQLLDFARSMEGQLASTIISDEADAAIRSTLMKIMRFKAGRVLDEAMPTGVAVSDAMVHGGAYPATGDARFTAVGMPQSLRRFSKMLCLDRVKEV